jgi:predicted phage baseplate assembly protein
MMLPSLTLDDLAWRAMVDAIRSRIAAVSDEQWTLHAPVDPGVTLLELFAYLLEQRVYWLDQVTDPLINAMIALLGAKPRPAQAATTVLEVITPGTSLVKGAIFERREHSLPVRLATTEDIALVAVERIEIAGALGRVSAFANSQPRWAIRPLTLLPADSKSAEVEITLWLRAPPVRDQWGKRATLLLELDAPSRIAAEWTREAVSEVPVAAPLEWWYSVSGASQRRPFAAEAIHDGTQGLRRSGVVRLAIPEQWAAAQAPVNDLHPFRLWLRSERASFSAPPRLRRLMPNVVAAAHAIPVTVPWVEIEPQVRKWLPLPGLSLRLSDPSPPLEPSVALRLLGRDRVWRDWAATSDFVRHGPEDAVFTVDRDANMLRFGDGLTGRLPVLVAGAGVTAELRYLAGGGEAGNLGSNLRWIAVPPGSAEAINPVVVRGGTEAETSSEARDRVSASLADPYRAVTAADHEAIAVATGGVAVARAHAETGFHPAFPCAPIPGAMTVFIVPEVPRHEGWLDSDRAVKAPMPDPGMLALVAAQLENRRLLAAEMFVRGAAYVEVEAVATLIGAPVDRSAVETRLREGLTAYLDPLIGGPEKSGWPFGQPVRPSEITHLLQQLAGDDADVAQVGIRLVDANKRDAPFEFCFNLSIASHELVVLRSLDMRWQPRSATSGGLR